MNRSLILLIICAALPLAAVAARMPHASSKRPSPQRPHRPEKPARIATPNVADTVDRLSRMPAMDRDRALAGLPAGQQKEIAAGLDRIEHLDPANREHLLDRYRRFDTLNPRQKDEIRGVLRQVKSLPVSRHQPVMEEIDRLNKLSPAERTRRLNGDEFRNRFSPDEKQIITAPSAALLGKM